MTRSHKRLTGLAAAYVAAIALILYPAFHEGFGFQVALWDCIPPTLGLIFLATASEKTTRYFVTSAIFAVLSTLVMFFFALAWFFTPLDTDPHSATTVLVFVFAPLWSIGIAIIASIVVWLAMRTRASSVGAD